MSYRAGIAGYSEARVTCDTCGIKRPVATDAGRPFAWFLDRKPAPGWKLALLGGRRVDMCGNCAKKVRKP